MTNEEKRKMLAGYMAECPACDPEDAEDVTDEDLDAWLTSHDPHWRAKTNGC